MQTVVDARWQAVRNAFEAALCLPEEARAACLDVHCAGDLAMREEVQALLRVAAHAGREGAADATAQVTMGWNAEREPRDALVGRQLGQWRVERLLGAGGMGAVYLGRRVSGDFDQDVAIKLLHIGISRSPELAARFRSERQILAQLDHPYIARLLDGGTLPEGLPYLVMEFVEGEPIALHCGLRKLPVQARIELMVKVCRAVQAAHRNLIVHRDLKPDNILVDTHGEPKLLDFGIAKVLDDASSVQTHADQRLLTPRYGAPEQFKGEPITTATDVYSLGVILYELLTGVSPYEIPAGDTMGLVRQVCEVEPHSPSERRERLSRHGALLDDLRFGADLDAIVMKTLRKTPGDRYGSVEALIDDLQRYLRDEPVLARQGSRLYRMRKFARRHRVALGMAAMALLAAVSTALVWRQQRDQVANERDKAREVTAVLVDLFDQGDPFLNPGKPPALEDVIRRGAQRLSAEQLADPLVRAELALTLSRVHQQIGAFADALALARRADADAQAAEAGAAFQVRTAGRLAEALLETDQFDAAGEQWARALALAAEVGDPALRAAALTGLGNLRRAQRRYADAVAALDEALALRLGLDGHADLDSAARTAAPGPAGEGLAEVAHVLCRALAEGGETRRAGTVCRQTLALKRGVYGADHPAQASTLSQLASLTASTGDTAGALALSRQVLDLLTGVLGPDHPRVGIGHLNLGADLRALGRLTEAETEAREAVRVFTLARGPDHAHTLLAHNNLANILYSQQRFEEALAAHQEVAARRARVLPADDPALVQSQFNIGKCLYRLRRWPEAAAAWTAVVQADTREGADTADHRLAELGLALVQLEQGRARVAAAEAERIAAAIRAEPDSRLGLATALYLRARAQQALGAPPDEVQRIAADAVAALDVDVSRDLLDADRLQRMASAD